jgi:hypothetical protein
MTTRGSTVDAVTDQQLSLVQSQNKAMEDLTQTMERLTLISGAQALMIAHLTKVWQTLVGFLSKAVFAILVRTAIGTRLLMSNLGGAATMGFRLLGFFIKLVAGGILLGVTALIVGIAFALYKMMQAAQRASKEMISLGVRLVQMGLSFDVATRTMNRMTEEGRNLSQMFRGLNADSQEMALVLGVDFMANLEEAARQIARHSDDFEDSGEVMQAWFNIYTKALEEGASEADATAEANRFLADSLRIVEENMSPLSRVLDDFRKSWEKFSDLGGGKLANSIFAYILNWALFLPQAIMDATVAVFGFIDKVKAGFGGNWGFASIGAGFGNMATLMVGWMQHIDISWKSLGLKLLAVFTGLSPQLIATIFGMMQNIWKLIMGFVPMMWNAGVSIIRSLWDGMKSIVGQVWDWLSSQVQGMLDMIPGGGHGFQAPAPSASSHTTINTSVNMNGREVANQMIALLDNKVAKRSPNMAL